MRLPFLSAAFSFVSAVAFAAEPAAGGYKTNVIMGPSSTTTNTTPVMPTASVFGGATFKVFQGANDVTGQVSVPASENQKAGLRFEPGQTYLMVRDAASTEAEKAVRGRRPFPVVLGGIGKSKDGVVVPFRAQPYFIYGRVPMVWEPGQKTYASGLTVFYEIEPEGVVPPTNFSVQVHFEATNGTVSPQEATITPTEQSQRVMVRSQSFDRPVTISMKIAGREFKSVTTVAGELSTLRLTPNQAEIAGFGAGQATLRVEGLDPLERLLTFDEATTVTLTVDGPATLTPATVSIPAGSNGADVILKSVGAGVATITAKTVAGASATTKVKLRAILGGLQLRSQSKEIAGFGAGQSEVHVMRVDPAGQPLVSGEALPVSFAVTGAAALTPSSITIPAGASEALVVLKSTTFGEATITASAGGKTSAPLKMGVRSVLGSLKMTAAAATIADFGSGQTDLTVQRLDPSGAPLVTEETLLVTFAVTGAGQAIPSTVTILAGQSSAKVVLKSNGAGEVAVSAAGGGSTSDEAKVGLTKTTHRIQFTPEKATALGLGFGSMKIKATRQDGAGKDFADPAALSVPMTISGAGVLEQPTAEFKAGETVTTVTVKGQGTGEATLKAGGGMGGNSAVITFTAPIALIVCALLGCSLGVTIRHFKARGETKRPSTKLIIRGVVVAIVVIAVGLVGAKCGVLPQGLVAGFGGALLFAGLLGLVGTYIADMVMSPPSETPAA